MRESIGGTFLLQIVLVFLTVYIGFMAVVINYGKVFRIKNTIVNYIEQQEGVADCSVARNIIVEQVGYLNNYKLEGRETDKGMIYKVTVNIVFTVPLVNTRLNIPVRGETRLIETGNLVPLTCTQSEY